MFVMSHPITTRVILKIVAKFVILWSIIVFAVSFAMICKVKKEGPCTSPAIKIVRDGIRATQAAFSGVLIFLKISSVLSRKPILCSSGNACWEKLLVSFFRDLMSFINKSLIDKRKIKKIAHCICDSLIDNLLKQNAGLPMESRLTSMPV